MLLRPVKKTYNLTFSKAMPAPTAGWNARDSLAEMKSNHAVVLDNYFPDETAVKLRGGTSEHKTGMTGNVESLIVYAPPSGSQKMFAANDGNIYDATLTGEIDSAEVSSMSNDRYQYVNFGTTGGQFLFICNGADTPKTYDGSSWADSDLTGPTLADLVWCNMHQRRLWVGEKDKLTAWYGGIDSISGAFTEFPLYGLASLGGYIMGMATWSRDGGAGPDDVAMFVTSEGEAILYSGTDPSDSSTWSLVGVFRIGRPIGRRFFIKAGADVVLITENGFVVGSQILQFGPAQAQKAAISDQINKAVNSAVKTSRSNFGWEAILYPQGKQLIFNIPIESGTSYQFVFNTNTRAPCRFKGMNANCWGVLNNNLYFGGKDGKVWRADYGNADRTSYIYGDIFPAFSYFGSANLLKKFNLCETVFNSEFNITPSLHLMTDFDIPDYQIPSTGIDYGDAAIWDTSLWDSDLWGGGADIFRKWRSVAGIGRAASLRILTATNNVQPELISINYVWQKGGMIG